MLQREEYVEQAYFFRVLVERLGQRVPLQELLAQTKHELLASTKLPMAIDLLLAELKHRGQMSAGIHEFIDAYEIDRSVFEQDPFQQRCKDGGLGAPIGLQPWRLR